MSTSLDIGLGQAVFAAGDLICQECNSVICCPTGLILHEVVANAISHRMRSHSLLKRLND